MNTAYFLRFPTLLLLALLLPACVFAQSWSALNGPTGGGIRKITMDANNNVYALVSEGDVYKSSNGGVSWSIVTGSVNYIHGLEAIGNNIYVNTWTDVFKSTNGGSTWTKVNTTIGMNFLDVGMSFIPGVNGLLVYGTQGAWISVDGGVNWKKIYDKLT
jgi:photosystem II stability/assembly factor-like uncharacterized protein